MAERYSPPTSLLLVRPDASANSQSKCCGVSKVSQRLSPCPSLPFSRSIPLSGAMLVYAQEWCAGGERESIARRRIPHP